MKPCYSYLRVSGLSQTKDDKDGFPRQLAKIQAFAEKAGFEIVREYREEGISGTKDESHRPAFAQMVSDILSNGVKTVLIEDLSRLARAYRIQESLVVYLASKGITLICASTEENITEAVQGDPLKKALVQIQGIFNELEKARLVNKLAHARAEKRRLTGKCEGQHGYPMELRHRLAKLRETLTLKQTAQTLNAEGSKTLKGHPWTAKAVSNAIYWKG